MRKCIETGIRFHHVLWFFSDLIQINTSPYSQKTHLISGSPRTISCENLLKIWQKADFSIKSSPPKNWFNLSGALTVFWLLLSKPWDTVFILPLRKNESESFFTFKSQVNSIGKQAFCFFSDLRGNHDSQVFKNFSKMRHFHFLACTWADGRRWKGGYLLHFTTSGQALSYGLPTQWSDTARISTRKTPMKRFSY